MSLSRHFGKVMKHCVVLGLVVMSVACTPVIEVSVTQLLDTSEDRALIQWQVNDIEGIDKVEIVPQVGEVELSGELLVVPEKTTEYTITGYANRSGVWEVVKVAKAKVYVGPRLMDVEFEDARLDACLRQLKLTHVEQVMSLMCSHYGVESLLGVEKLTELSALFLEENNISDISPLQDLVKLETLNLTNNRIAELSPLSELKDLTFLMLGGNKISDLRPISSLLGIEVLWLDNNEVVDVSALVRMEQLKVLALYNNVISDVTPLSYLTNLSLLDVSNNKIVTGVLSLQSLVNIEGMKLTGNNQVPCLTYFILVAQLSNVLFDDCSIF
jgi:Leucine-rich repeat (LRR) protein